MTRPFHTLVWIDHQTARLYDVTRHDLVERQVLRVPDAGTGHIHHRAGTPGPGHTALGPAFLSQVTGALADAGEILIVGPGAARFELKAHLEMRAAHINARVVGVEPMDKPGREDLQAFAALYFRQKDLMKKP